MKQKLTWNVVRRAHKERLFHEDDVDSKDYKGGLSTRKRQGKHEDFEETPPIRDEYESDFSTSDEEVPVGQQPSIKVRAPVHKDKALAAVQKCKVLRGLSIRGQVRIANLLQHVTYSCGTELWSAKDAHEKRFVLIETGEVENWLPATPDVPERFVGRCGPGSVLGGLFAVGSFSHPVFTVRVAADDERQPLEAWEINSTSQEQFSTSFHAEEMHVLRRRVLQDLRLQLLPFLQQMLASRGFFSRYSEALISKLVKDMDLRLFERGQVIFKERAPGRSLGLIVRGSVDISANGRRITSKGPGQEIGEAALLENGYRRHATTRCGEKSESLLFMVSREAFHACFEKFPEEKMKLAQQVRHRIAMTVLKETFTGCSQEFVHLLSTECDIVQLTWPKMACTAGEVEEVMHLFYSGELTVDISENDEQTSRFARRWEIFGLEAALGLREGPPKYGLTAGRAGCTLVRMTRASVMKALHFFPSELMPLLHAAGLQGIPNDHPFLAQQDLIWETVQPLLRQMLCNADLKLEFCKGIATQFTPSVYDAGCMIVAEGSASKEAVLVLSGDVAWSQKDVASGTSASPAYFDLACMYGGHRVHTASQTLTAQTTTVVWRLGLQDRSTTDANDHHVAMLALEVHRVQELQQEIQARLRASLRNMRTWRRFRSEVIEMLCDKLNLQTYLPGQRIFEASDLGEFIFILAQGRVEVQSQGKSSILEEGATFGEMVLFGQPFRNVTATAQTLCVLNAIHKDLVSYALKQAPRDAVVPEVLPPKVPPERIRGEARAARHVAQQAAPGVEQVTTPTPKELRQRLERKWLVQMPSPRLPPVDTGLYRTPLSMNAKMQSAFKGVMPADAVMAASHMHGVREAYRHRSPRHHIILGLDELPPVTPGRKRATPAYTDRLQSVSLRRKACQHPATDGWQDSQKGFSVVSNLQALAVSLSRLSSKPSISKFLQSGVLPEHNEHELISTASTQTFSYAQQLQRSALAYGLCKPKQKPPSNGGQESPAAILDYLSDDSGLSDAEVQPEEKPRVLVYAVRRIVYETIATRQLHCPVRIHLGRQISQPTRADGEGHLDVNGVQLRLHVDLAESGSEPSVRTIASASLRSSPRDSLLEPWDTSPVPVEAQDSQSSTRLHSAEARELIMQMVDSLD